MRQKNFNYLKKKSHQIRKNIIEMLVPYESHHIGCSLSIVEILAVLYFETLHVFPKKPNHPLRDIFILSKGHGAAALYSTLAERGFFSKKILQTYDRDGGKLPEHTSHAIPGVEVSTGSLGHGLSMGIGFALASLNDKKKNKVFVLISDGELNEGSTWEAIMFAGHHKLSNLCVIVDANGFQGYGKTKDILNLEPYPQKFKEFGWEAVVVDDGHDLSQINNAYESVISNQYSVVGKKQKTEKLTTDNRKPTIIIAKTIKGKGIPFFEGKFESHYKSVDELTKQKILAEL